MMDQGAEPTEVLTPVEHAAALRALILTAAVAAITSAVDRYTAMHPDQPWHLDSRPGAARLGDCVDAALDDVLEVVLLRPVDQVTQSFPARFVLA
jgi:hypothetical protein